jgi:hypothetical protein
MDINDEPWVDANGAVALIYEKTGVKIPKSRLHKDSSSGRAPRPDGIYGTRYMYRPEKIIAYGWSLVRPLSEVA